MPSNDPLAAAWEAATKLRDQVIPKARDRFAKKTTQPRISLERVAGMEPAEAEAFVARESERHGAAAVERLMRQEATKRLRKAGLL